MCAELLTIWKLEVLMHLYRGRVVGINHSPAKENFKTIMSRLQSTPLDKVEIHLKLVPEPDNAYDCNAILVMFGDKQDKLLKIGYIPKENTRKIHEVGADNLKCEIANFNKFQENFVGIDILVTKK